MLPEMSCSLESDRAKITETSPKSFGHPPSPPFTLFGSGQLYLSSFPRRRAPVVSIPPSTFSSTLILPSYPLPHQQPPFAPTPASPAAMTEITILGAG